MIKQMKQLSWNEDGGLDRTRLRRNMIMIYKVKREKMSGMQNCLFGYVFSLKTHSTRKM